MDSTGVRYGKGLNVKSCEKLMQHIAFVSNISKHALFGLSLINKGVKVDF